MTNFELALTMKELGAVTASALDAGGSTTIAFDGKLLNRPSDGRERPVAEALDLLYYGVYVPPPAATVVSPNGDGVADTQQLQLKVVRPSTVTGQLAGPGGVTIPLDSGARAPGRYSYTWDARLPDGSPAPEGEWRFTAEADDDLGRHSAAERAFSLNKTLGFVSAPRTLLVSRRGGRLSGAFALARPARVVVTVQTVSGVIFRTLTLGALDEGRHAFVWDGRDGKRRPVPRGSYVVRVAAVNDVGRALVDAPVDVRRG
jgi:flagellar hook assembly protein FlgD